MVSLLSQSASPGAGGCFKAAQEALDVQNLQVGLVITQLVWLNTVWHVRERSHQLVHHQQVIVPVIFSM